MYNLSRGAYPFAAASGIGGQGGNYTGSLNNGTAGTTNTGAGGGGGSAGNGSGASGGSGVVIIGYPRGARQGSGGTITTTTNYIFHKFTTNGTFTT
jgi:hypothetical protein